MTLIPYNRTYIYGQLWPTPHNVERYGNPLSPFGGKICILIYRCIYCVCVCVCVVQRVNEDRRVTVQCNDTCIKLQEIHERAGVFKHRQALLMTGRKCLWLIYFGCSIQIPLKLCTFCT
jgi:hypothetical protein